MSDRHPALREDDLAWRLARSLGTEQWQAFVTSDAGRPQAAPSKSLDDPRFTLLRPAGLTRRQGGLLEAVRTAAETASCVMVISDDADPVVAATALLQSMQATHADIVVGHREFGGGFLGGDGREQQLRVCRTRVSRRLARLALTRARNVGDPMSGLFAFRPAVIDGVGLDSPDSGLLLEILARGRWLRVSETPIRLARVSAAPARPSPRDARRLVGQIVSLRRALPGRSPVPDPATVGKDRSLRILILTSEAPPVVSGISRSVAMLTEGLRAAGHHVDVLSRADFPRLARQEVRLSTFGLFWPRIRRMLSQYDVVNVHGPVPTMSETFLWLIRGMAEVSRPGVLYTHHSDLAIPGLERWCETYNRTTSKLAHVADSIVVTSEDYRPKMERLHGAPVTVIPWAVDPGTRVRPRTSPTPGRLRVLFVGQLRPYKGLHELVAATAMTPEVTLTIVGDGPMRAEIEGLVAELGPRARMRGRVSDDQLWEAYACADVVALPSTTTAEAFGLVLAEGMAAGCVPVASDLPGVRSVAGATGMLVEPGDHVALARVFSELAADQDQLRAKSVASRFRQTGTVEAMIKAYEELLCAAAHDSVQRQSHQVTPRTWADPAGFLREIDLRLGTTNASLTVVHDGGDQARVWRAGRMAEISHAPVATYAARLNRPLLIDGSPQPRALSELLRREDVTSSLLMPVPVGAWKHSGHRGLHRRKQRARAR